MKLLPRCNHCKQWPHGAAACCDEYDGKEHYDRKEVDAEITMWKKGFHGLELEIAEHKKNMVWALKMLYNQEKGNPVYEEMCSKYFCKGKELG